MKSTTVEAFLLGITFGIGITILSLYIQKPGCLVTSLDTVAEMGRARKAREEEKRLQRERLKDMGFLDDEVREIL